MKLVKEVIYETLTPEPIDIKDMDTHLENNKFTTTPINFYYEVGETDDLVVFMNIYGFPYDTSDGDDKEMGRVYQVETAVFDKFSTELIYMLDNDGFSKVNHLSHLPIWDHETLKRMATGIRDTGENDFFTTFHTYLSREDIHKLE